MGDKFGAADRISIESMFIPKIWLASDVVAGWNSGLYACSHSEEVNQVLKWTSMGITGTCSVSVLMRLPSTNQDTLSVSHLISYI